MHDLSGHAPRRRPAVRDGLVVTLAVFLGACAGDDDGGAPSGTAATVGEPITLSGTALGNPTEPDPQSATMPGGEPAGAVHDLTLLTPDGRERSAHVYVPASMPADDPVPLLVGLHGGTGSGPQFEESSGFDRLAEENAFIAAYPDGTGVLRTWNGGVCCGRAVTDGVDDVVFLRQFVEELSAQYEIDPDRVFVTGHSNGMIMAYRVLCEAADVFVAAAGQAGTLGVEHCEPSDPVSLLHIHGADDANLPIDGGRGEGLSGVDFPSPTAGIRTVAAADGCPREPTLTTDGPATTETWEPCEGATTVEFVTVAGADHGWMGSPSSFRPGGPEPFQDYDSSAGVWSFLAQHPRV